MARLGAVATLLMVGGCPEVPPACEAFCADQGAALQRCVDDGSARWSELGWEDADAFDASCGAWAWSLVRLAPDRGRAAGHCEQAIADLSASEDETAEDCPASAFDWNAVPW